VTSSARLTAGSLGTILAGLQSEANKTNPFDFSVGVITAFSNTGENSVRIHGVDVPNVPMLNSSTTVSLQVGDNVVVLKYRTGYFILGRVITAGSDNFGSEATDFDGYLHEVSGFSVTTSLTTLVSMTFTVPPWAHGAVIIASAHLQCQNTTAGTSFIYVRIVGDVGGISSFGSTTMLNRAGAGEFSYVGVSFQQAINVIPNETILVGGQCRGDAAFASDVNNRLALTVSLIYRRSNQHGVPILVP
jgi:hypothetical protein